MLNGCFVNPSSATKLVWGSPGQDCTGPRPDCFLKEGYGFHPPHLPQSPHCSPAVCAGASSISFPVLSPPFIPLALPTPSLCSPHLQSDSLQMLRASELDWRCVVRVCGLGSAERLLTGWMRASNTVYFNLFRMLELCSAFLLGLPCPASSFHPSQLQCRLTGPGPSDRHFPQHLPV